MPLAPIPLSDCRKIGIGVQRPEDVVVGRDGRVWASDERSACAQLLPDGSLRRVGTAGGTPNGINMDAQGRVIIANFEAGPLQRLDVESGVVEIICSEVAGRRLTANYRSSTATAHGAPTRHSRSPGNRRSTVASTGCCSAFAPMDARS
jgi:gluconolactonase